MSAHTFRMHPCECGDCHGWAIYRGTVRLLGCQLDPSTVAAAVDSLNHHPLAVVTVNSYLLVRRVGAALVAAGLNVDGTLPRRGTKHKANR
jgi:hypothetical protein